MKVGAWTLLCGTWLLYSVTAGRISPTSVHDTRERCETTARANGRLVEKFREAAESERTFLCLPANVRVDFREQPSRPE
jgi:hypothetical protein